MTMVHEKHFVWTPHVSYITSAQCDVAEAFTISAEKAEAKLQQSI